jgi:inner membrane protein
MEIITHLLLSIVIGRAGLNRLSRLAMPMLIASGLAADLDWLSAIGGPRAFLVAHRAASHSIIVAAMIAFLVALIFTLAGKRQTATPVRFSRAFLICGIGAALHLLLDVTNMYGVKLLWPFSDKWFALDIMSAFDLVLLAALAAGILLPILFRLVSEEIGERPKSRGAAVGAILALSLVVVYVGSRYVLHDRAVTMLTSRLYRGAVPLAVDAFPDSPSPFRWAGLVVTENAILRLDVPVVFGTFDPFSAKPFYKPDASAALDAARLTLTAQLFLGFARFPRATIRQSDSGFHVEITDLRFELGTPPGRSITAVIDLNPQSQVIREQVLFGDLFPR